MIKRIDSVSNPSFKAWHGLTIKKYRDREGMFLLEGEVLIGEAIREGAQVKDILIRGGSSDGEAIARRLLENAPGEGKNIRLYSLGDELFEKLAQTENGRDIIAALQKPSAMMERTEERLKDNRYIGSILVLDRVQDPGNMGTIIRAADAFGIAGIAAIKGCADIFSPKTVRSAAGSLLRVPVVQLEDSDELFLLAEKLGLKVMATGLKNSEDIGEASLGDGLAIVIGNEGRGVSEEILEKAEKIVKIPMEGSIDSLNAGVAAAIILYECRRKKSIERG